MKNQRTIKQAVTISGVGLHTGKRTILKLLPARANTGIRFVRSDMAAGSTERPMEILANVKNVQSTTLATTLGLAGQSVSTVEHLMSALWALGIDNVICSVQGEEVPILDGSAAPFAALIRRAGIKRQKCPKQFLIAHKEVAIKEGNKWAILKPSREFSIRYTIDFPHPTIGTQSFEYNSKIDFIKEIAPSRTFGFLKDVERMQSMGLALGGSLDNAVVLDEEKALNPGGLRFKDEFVRHKILDAIGDFSLVGHPILASIELYKAGHELQTRLIHTLLADPSAYSIYTPESDEELENHFCLSQTAYAF